MEMKVKASIVDPPLPDNVALSMASGQRLWKSLCSLPHQKHILLQDHRDVGWQERKLQEIYEEFPAGISLSHMKGSEILVMFRMHVNECSVKVTVDKRNNGSVILTLACHTQNVLHDCSLWSHSYMHESTHLLQCKICNELVKSEKYSHWIVFSVQMFDLMRWCNLSRRKPLVRASKDPGISHCMQSLCFVKSQGNVSAGFLLICGDQMNQWNRYARVIWTDNPPSWCPEHADVHSQMAIGGFATHINGSNAPKWSGSNCSCLCWSLGLSTIAHNSL